ncbi:MAG: FAD-dependent oxidoreductase [Paracoccaceae bacterium]
MADVTVRGAGIFGLSIAWACQQRGASVIVVDPFGVGAGSSGGVVGALAPHTPENWNPKKAFQLDSLLSAGPFWAAVEADTGLKTGYGRTGRLQSIADSHALDLARAREASAKDLWQGKATWAVIGDNQKWAPVSATGHLIHDTLSARIHPSRACAALAAAIQVGGGKLLPEAPDLGTVVWATGAQGLDDLSKELGKNIGGPQKGQAALLRPAVEVSSDAPQILVDAVHVVPHYDGTVAIGSTSEGTFDNPTSTDRLLDSLIARAITAVPALAGAQVIARWAGLRPRTRSRAPILGKHPTRPGHFIANGGFKIGFGMAPKIADVMTDLILEGKDLIPDDFRIES